MMDEEVLNMEQVLTAEETAIPLENEYESDESQDAAASAAALILHLTFQLGNDLFGINVNSVKEVMEYKRVFKTPGVPDYIRGVINLRGEVVPVIDLSSRFYNSRSSITDSTGIVVVEIPCDNELVPIGVMIDSVRAVAGIPENDIEAAPEIGSRIRNDFIIGIGKLNNQFIILLNIDNVLNIDELSNIDSFRKSNK